MFFDLCTDRQVVHEDNSNDTEFNVTLVTMFSYILPFWVDEA